MRIKILWADYFRQWQESGLSRRKFCEVQVLSYVSFMYHQKRSVELAQDEGNFEQVFIHAKESSEKIEFCTPAGGRWSFPVHTPKELIRFLISL
ncbi:MAG TPA: hypothetical protein VFV37_01195 [Luteibaculaceae bacterium]|nr:hypothetical protein [Luteibaculaceae bacterium]